MTMERIEQALSLKVWRCRNPLCRPGKTGRVLMEVSCGMRGVIVKVCEKCGTINRMKDGVEED